MTAAPALLDPLLAPFAGAPALLWWSAAKDALEQQTGIDNSLVHLLVGALLWLIVERLSRRPVLAWTVAMAATLANEIADLAVERWPDPMMQYGESLADIAWTMALPTLATIGLAVSRWRQA